MEPETVEPLVDDEALLKRLGNYRNYPAGETKTLDDIGDVDIAQRVSADLRLAANDNVIFSEGQILYYTGKYWKEVPDHTLRLHVHKYNGSMINKKRLTLSKGKIDGVINELKAILAVEPGFFSVQPTGMNCQNGFVLFENGVPRLTAHDPEHRQRHLVPGEWHPEALMRYSDSLLEKLLAGSFRGDEDVQEKIERLQEIAGAGATGSGTRVINPKAVVLLGRTAENGKSQILQLFRGMLIASAVAAVTPTKFSDDRYLVKLVGKTLNTCDELGTSGAIGSELFKSVVTGEPVSARDMYESAIDFCCRAQHVFSCNQLPAFQGGMDRGVIRRLEVIPFNRTIPPSERVLHIAERILKEEPDLALAWTVEGAARLLTRGRHLELPSSKAALLDWCHGADPVQGWMAERLEHAEGEKLDSRTAYSDFDMWAKSNGYGRTLPSKNTFSQRLQAAGVDYGHSGNFRGFRGVRLRELGAVEAVW